MLCNAKGVQIMTRSCQTGLTAVSRGISYVLKDSWDVRYPLSSYKYSIFHRIRNSIQHRCEVYLTTFGSNFNHLLQYSFSLKCFLSKMLCYFYSFCLLLCTIARNYGIFDLASLFDFETSLCPQHFLQVCRSGSKTLCIHCSVI